MCTVCSTFTACPPTSDERVAMEQARTSLLYRVNDWCYDHRERMRQLQRRQLDFLSANRYVERPAAAAVSASIANSVERVNQLLRGVYHTHRHMRIQDF